MNQTYDQLFLLVLRLIRNQDQHHLQLVRLHFILLLFQSLFLLFLLQALALAKVLLHLDFPRSLVRFLLHQAKAKPLPSLHQALTPLSLYLVETLAESQILQCLLQAQVLLHLYLARGLAKVLLHFPALILQNFGILHHLWNESESRY